MIIIFITCWAHKTQTFTLISLKIMIIWKIFTNKPVFKHKEVVSNLHVCSNGPGKCDLHIHLTFLQLFSPPHIRKYLIFFRIIYNAMPNNQYSALDNVKIICKRIGTKVSFKITLWKIHVHIDICRPWIWNHCFYFGIWNDDCTKMIVLVSIHLSTRLNSQNTNETEFINKLYLINLFMNIRNSNWHNWSFDLT